MQLSCVFEGEKTVSSNKSVHTSLTPARAVLLFALDRISDELHPTTETIL
jgi:hypothetical protein